MSLSSTPPWETVPFDGSSWNARGLIRTNSRDKSTKLRRSMESINDSPTTNPEEKMPFEDNSVLYTCNRDQGIYYGYISFDLVSTSFMYIINLNIA